MTNTPPATSLHIALPSCANLPDWEVDDRPLHAALEARGVHLHRPAWDDADFDWQSCAACLIRTTWDYQEHLPKFLAWAERVSRVTKLLNPLEVIRWNTHKTYLRALEPAGVPTVPTIWVEADQPINIAEALEAHGWDRGFLKPCIGATARETLRFSAEPDELASAQAHLDRMVNDNHEMMMLQPYISTVETDGEFSVLIIDGQPTHCVQKIPVPGDYRVQDDFGASDRLIESDPTLVSLGLNAVRSVEEKFGTSLLYARCDFLRNTAGEYQMNELELVEPSLFFRHNPAAADKLAAALLQRITTTAKSS